MNTRLRYSCNMYCPRVIGYTHNIYILHIRNKNRHLKADRMPTIAIWFSYLLRVPGKWLVDFRCNIAACGFDKENIYTFRPHWIIESALWLLGWLLTIESPFSVLFNILYHFSDNCTGIHINLFTDILKYRKTAIMTCQSH